MGSKFLDNTQTTESLFNGTGNMNANSAVFNSLSADKPVRSSTGKKLVSGNIIISEVTNLQSELDSKTNDWQDGDGDDLQPINASHIVSSQNGMKTDTIDEFNNGVGTTFLEQIVMSNNKSLEFPDINDPDAINFGDNAWVGLATAKHLRLTQRDDTKQIQMAFNGTVRGSFEEDNGDLKFSNPNGGLLFEGGIEANGLDFSNISSLAFQDTNKVNKIIIKDGMEIGSRNNDLSMDVEAGNFIEFRVDNDNVCEVDETGLRVSRVDELDNNTGVFVDDLHIMDGVVEGPNRSLLDSNNPNGIIDGTAQTNSFVDGSRTFTVTPTDTEFSFYSDGLKYTKTGAENTVIADKEGTHVIYYDGDSLTDVYDPTSAEIKTIIVEKCLLAFLYWDDDNNSAIYFSGDNELLHTPNMAGETHYYLHNVLGAQFGSGCALNNLSVDASGNDNTSAQFGIDAGTLYDEDALVTLALVLNTTGAPIWYRDGTSDWRTQTNAGFSVLTAGTGRCGWNENTGGNFGISEIGNGNFVNYHIWASNNTPIQFLSIMGQEEYGNIGNARDGAQIEINSLLLGGLPIQEMFPVATVIFQTSNTYSNDVKSRVRSDGNSNDYVDWRFSDRSSFATTDNHNNLSGLQGGTADEYNHLTTSEHTELTDYLPNVTLASNGDTTVPNLTATTKVDVPTIENSSGSLTIESINVSGKNISEVNTITAQAGALQMTLDVYDLSNPTSLNIENSSSHQCDVVCDGNINCDGGVTASAIESRSLTAGANMSINKASTSYTSDLVFQTASADDWKIKTDTGANPDLILNRETGTGNVSIPNSELHVDTIRGSTISTSVNIDKLNFDSSVSGEVTLSSTEDDNHIIIYSATDDVSLMLKKNNPADQGRLVFADDTGGIEWYIGYDSTPDFVIQSATSPVAFRANQAGDVTFAQDATVSGVLNIGSVTLDSSVATTFTITDSDSSTYMKVISTTDNSGIIIDKGIQNAEASIRFAENGDNEWYCGIDDQHEPDWALYSYLRTGGGARVMRIDAYDGVYDHVVSSGRTMEVDSAGNVGATGASLRELKMNIEPLRPIDWLYSLKCREFDFKKRVTVVGPDGRGKREYLDEPWDDDDDPSTREYGLIYDEVINVAPEIADHNFNYKHKQECKNHKVSGRGNHGNNCDCPYEMKPFGVKYQKLIIPLLKGLQDQKTIIDTLTSQMIVLQNTVAQLQIDHNNLKTSYNSHIANYNTHIDNFHN